MTTAKPTGIGATLGMRLTAKWSSWDRTSMTVMFMKVLVAFPSSVEPLGPHEGYSHTDAQRRHGGKH